MPKTPQVSGKELVKVLRGIGFTVVSQKGSHIKMKQTSHGSTKTVTVPNHKTIKKGTFGNILKYADISLKDFLELR